MERIEVWMAVRISEAPFLLPAKLLLAFLTFGVWGVNDLKHWAFRCFIADLRQAFLSDHLSVIVILDVVDNSLNVKKLDSKIFSSLDYICLHLLYFFDVERVSFSKDGYHISELLKLLDRHEILVLRVMAIEEKQHQMNPFVKYFLKLILLLLSVILKL